MAPPVRGVETRPEGATAAFLLVHGFCAAPNEVRTLGEYLSALGIASFAVELAGHNSSVEDLKKTTWKDWYNSVERGLEYVRTWNTEKVLVAGISLGGVLSIILAANEPIDGLVLIAPALKLDGLALKLVPILKYFMKDREIDVVKAQEIYEVKRTKYDREPVSAGHELLKAVKAARKSLSRVTAPTLVIQGAKDKSINPESGRTAYEGIASTQKELYMIEEGEHVITCHYTRHEAYSHLRRFMTDTIGLDIKSSE
ncbi:MAG: hypothetical protein DRO87_04545 [Candidatus Thorarchaeota archaeon]|nr:MAG: hypothetical protein DRP09_00065 [Candidatus Thorarchaeota archaeon]RLI58872.1 MAG: hypothetical protein DRO87_04545 [Candidatus Thorarchaeota archaeon]